MTFKDCLVRFFRDEEGASGIEYALIAVMVAVVIAGFVGGIGGKIGDVFTAVDENLVVPAP